MRQISTLALLLALVGCGDSSTAPVATPVKDASIAENKPMEPPGGQSEPLPVTSPDTASGELKIDILDWDQTQAIVAAHPGKVVVFDLWATYCPPCLKELPGLVALQAKYPEQVVCVSVCLDYEGDASLPPSKIEPDIREVLTMVKAHAVRNVLLSTSSEDLFKIIEHQSMPVAYLFDQTGQRVMVLPDLKDPEEFTYAKDITPAVEKLLANPGKP